ncbi:MAG: ABC transporter substrate-binding protein [Eubacteriales bacterium]
MKKVIALLLVMAMIVPAAVSCTSSENPGNGDGTETTDGSGDTSAADDSGEKLNVVEFDKSKTYTYKDSVSTMATNWNPHTYETNDDAYPADFLRVGLYGFYFNDALHPVEGKEDYAGYVIVPEMAASDPVDVTEKIKASNPEFGIPESATKGYAYTIDLNQNACWEDGTPINADTYVYSMKQVLNPELLNYRATDYYAGDLCIAGAENYANSGRTIKKSNAPDGATPATVLADAKKGDDGVYVNADGGKLYFALNDSIPYLSDSLSTYAEYFPEGVWDKLAAMGDENGYVPVTDESKAALYEFVGSDTWGNEPVENLDLYAFYEYTYPVADFANVGIMKTGDYQITLVFGKSLAGFNLYYNLSSNWIVKQDLYEANLKKDGDAWFSSYNTSVETTSSYGPYKLVSYQADKSMRFERNEKWYGYTDGKHVYQDPEDGLIYPMYQTTAIDTQVVAEAATNKLMFLKGELMTYGLQAEDFATYRNSDYTYVTPSETIFFFIFNGYLDAINSREANDGYDTSKYDLQTMTLTTFRKAVAVSYDKELFASTVSPARSGGYGLIGNSYIYDPDTGSRYRDTDQAKQVLCDFYSIDTSKFSSLDEAVDSITGYDPVAAKELYKKAFDEAIAAGYITDADGDGKSDQTVQIEYAMSADNDFMTKTIDYLNEKMNEATKDTPFDGKIQFVKSAPYGNDWSTKLKNGMADVSLAGWSGSALNPFSLTEQYTNPSYQYDAKWFDATSKSLELSIDIAKIGEPADVQTVKMNLAQWSQALNGATVTVGDKEYNFGDGIAEVQTRLTILAAIEGAILETYDYIPMLQNASMALLSQQVFYVVEEYNPILGRGGIQYMKYNYDDAAWTEYVTSQGGELKY